MIMKGMYKIGMNSITHLHTYYDADQVVKGRHIFSIAALGKCAFNPISINHVPRSESFERHMNQ